MPTSTAMFTALQNFNLGATAPEHSLAILELEAYGYVEMTE